MTARPGISWQTLLADLSLILFMITASAVSQAREKQAAPTGRPAMAEPVAVWRPTPGGATLAQWLVEQPGDARLRLTMRIHAFAGAEAEALRLIATAAPQARVVIDRDAGPPLEAILAYDQLFETNRTTQP